ncbi:ROK family transcriptional regulator [Pseudoalteromonas tunicata]|uniref:ROK family transcriptional regulator n=1 Tax=Pseudoalteromonas tunicata TaxID=314281 RepID=UPI000BBFDA80|nr:ROK family transcriptional regulator [Pseudoalteromonas tunicata]ATC96518.1 hypothetical protein PTUN_b0045 [Pseudoalteromonas tunicata]AXT33477.1 ROK family transcriptional regulator [Pseudoalteromonas tunicata]
MKGSNSKQNKALNLRLVLAQIVTLGPISRIEIARNTHLTKQTITNMVEELLAANLVQELGVKKQGSVGKPSQMLSINKTAAYTLGFRINEHDIEAGIFTLDGDQINRLTMPYQSNDLLKQAQFLFETLLRASQLATTSILGAGLSFSHVKQRTVESYQQSKALQLLLAEALDLPIAMETTASACAAYQMLFGEAKELHSFVYVHISEVIESAVVYNRKIILGQNGLTGAMGDLFVTPETDDTTAELGRLNDFASLASLKTMINQPDLSNEQLMHYYQTHPQKFENWFEQAAEPMRIALHTLESILNSQTIILGGDINDAFLDKFITQLRPFIPSIAQFGERKVVRLVKTPDVENIALKGIATLPLHAALNHENMQTLHLEHSDTMLTPIQQLIY